MIEFLRKPHWQAECVWQVYRRYFMNTQRRRGSLLGVIAIVAVTMACVLPSTTPQAGRPTETPTATGQAVLPASGGSNGTGNSAGGGTGDSGGGNSGGGVDSA